MCNSWRPCALAYVECVRTSVSLSSSTAVLFMRTHCGHLTLFFHQPASLLTSYVPPPPPPHSSLSLSTSPLAVGLASERAQCVDWTEGVLYQSAIGRTHRRTQTSQAYWPPHSGQPQSVWRTSVTSQLATGVKSVCVCMRVCVCE